MTSTNLPAGVWRDNEDAAKLWCPCSSNKAVRTINHETGQERVVAFRDEEKLLSCLGSRCAACREYQETGFDASGGDWYQKTVGYYCGKAGRP